MGRLAVGGRLGANFQPVVPDQLMSAMVAAHTEVPDTAPLNASLVRDRVDAAAKLGVVWSPALFAVLDDISRRKEQ